MGQTNILLESGTNELEIVEFFLEEPDPSGEGAYRGHYGVNVAKVLEIIRMPKITEMPEVSHPAVLGAFNQRSRIIPLVDLAAWLGKERVELEPPKVVVTEFNNITTAFMVSGVTRIHRISWEQVEPPGKFVTSLSNNSITGVVKMDERIIFILDLEKIVTDLNPELGLRLEEAANYEEGEPHFKALIADDSSLIRSMLSDLLQKAGFIVETTNNGHEAWTRLGEIKEMAKREARPMTDYVQVVVSDIEMPKMDGHNLTKRIKDDPELKALPVVLFSSLITDRLRHKGESVGADDQISKPEVSELATRAKQLIREKAKSAA
jgi:two-component system chemotaxis response regulator CheV